MGTNYYLHQKDPCKHCGRAYESLHIGKSSGGWAFALHVDPENYINTLDDWRRLWNEPGTYIYDEDNEVISIEEMERCITQRGKNLRRHDLHDGFCVGRGEGTWDYVQGYFS